MKNRIAYILIALLAVTQIYSMSKIARLESQIRNTNNTISSIDGNLSGRINAIYSNVDAMLEEKSSIIHHASTSFGSFDTDTLTVPVHFTVEPKQVTDSMTVSLKFDDETIQLQKQDTTYKGTKVFDLSEDEINPDIIIVDHETKTLTQDNGLRIDALVSEFIPRLYAVSPFGSSITTRANSDTVTYQQSGELFIDGNYEDFEKVQYVTYIDKEKINEINIDLSLSKIGEPIFPSDAILKLQKGQILTTYIVALDNLGLTHYYPIEYYEVGSDVQREPYYDIVRITDKNGKLVYDSTGNGKYAEEYGIETEIIWP